MICQRRREFREAPLSGRATDGRKYGECHWRSFGDQKVPIPPVRRPSLGEDYFSGKIPSPRPVINRIFGRASRNTCRTAMQDLGLSRSGRAMALVTCLIWR